MIPFEWEAFLLQAYQLRSHQRAAEATRDPAIADCVVHLEMMMDSRIQGLLEEHDVISLQMKCEGDPEL